MPGPGKDTPVWFLTTPPLSQVYPPPLQGGGLGSPVWAPGVIPSGLGFAFDAGNTYHSLEYQQYEVLQVCY